MRATTGRGVGCGGRVWLQPSRTRKRECFRQNTIRTLRDVTYEVLGHLRVLDVNGVEVQLSAPKLRTLLALLLVNRGRPVSLDRIADTLWDGPAPTLGSQPALQSRWSSRHPYASDVERKVPSHQRCSPREGPNVQLFAPKLRTLLAPSPVIRGVRSA